MKKIFTMNQVECFISTVRDSFIGSQQVYTEGSCYHFYLILKQVFPDAEPYYDHDHILTKINGEFYDITGKVLPSFPETCFHKLETIADYRLMSPYNIYKNKQ